jgi:hypothetical protein
VLPDYEGGSIANIAPSVAQALAPAGASALEGLLPPLSAGVLDPALLRDARVIVLLVLDGFGQLSLGPRATQFGPLSGATWASGQLTSIFPSTTAVALTCLQTGTAPSQHGVGGYTLFLPAVGRVMNMIQFKPVDGGELTDVAIDPATFLSTPTIFARLTAAGIACEVVSHREYARSPLTIMQAGDTPYSGHRTLSELCALLMRAVEQPGKRFVFGYWAGIDMLAHTYGPAADVCRLEADLVEQAVIHGFLMRLSKGHDDVAVIVTADHGLASVPESMAVAMSELLRDGPSLLRSPSGERRAVGLSLADEAARRSLANAVGDKGVVLSTAEAVDAGLFGPTPAHPELVNRIGDTLLLARGQRSFPFRAGRDAGHHSAGAHGSLTAEEMLVPLHVWRF